MTPKPNDRRTWELALLARATRFIVSTPIPNRRGERKRWEKEDVWVAAHLSLRVALTRACEIARGRACSDRALIYAVDDATGEQCALSREDWL